MSKAEEFPGPIDDFSGTYGFLSNFYLHGFWFNGRWCKSSEHAFQAEKAVKEEERTAILHANSPHQAKKRGRACEYRKDWESIKIGVMRQVLAAKFSDQILRKWLLATGDRKLIEGNWWDDRFWGVCDGEGENWLGRLLMELRDEIRGSEPS